MGDPVRSHRLIQTDGRIELPPEVPAPVADLLRRVSHLNRVSNSDDMESAQQAFIDYFASHYRGTAQLHQFKPGEVFNHWRIPQRWNVRGYELTSEDGFVIADHHRHPLAVCPFSDPTDEVLDLNGLREKVICHATLNDAFAYFGHRMYRHWVPGWNISLPRSELDALPEGRYRVRIDTERTEGPLCAFEYKLSGKLDKTIFLVGHICHPGQVNDSLSGCLALLQAIAAVENRLGQTTYTYRILLVPELFGTVPYLKRHESLLDDALFALCTNMTSHDADMVMCHSKRGDSLLDMALAMALRQSGKEHDIAPFNAYPDCGDEICFDTVGYRIPAVTLSRKGINFDRYHSSADDLERFLNADAQARHQDFVSVVASALMILESNFEMTPTFRGMPCLSNPDIDLYLSPANINNSVNPDGLFADLAGREIDTRFFMEFFLDAIDHAGITPLEIAWASGIDFWTVQKYATQFAAKGLVETQPCERSKAMAFSPSIKLSPTKVGQ
jgi:aminopeptidase-like protein